MYKSTHAAAADVFLQNKERAGWHDDTLWFIRQKRDRAAKSIPEWETLRTYASQIKKHTLSNLAFYLEEFEKKAKENGVVVHWAADAIEHNSIVFDIIKKSGIRSVVKSKSMLTEECHLNAYLSQRGIDVVDTDLGERIIQLREETPSHIVLPAIHLKKQEVAQTFEQHLGTEPGNQDPFYLTASARADLRNNFIKARVAMTGVNFAIAETGGLVVCTNEGNADLGVNCADIHIACMGIEKIIPASGHLAVFLRLLARSATGQPITTYSSHFIRPVSGKQMHVIIVDNGRSRQLARPEYRSALQCIRCAACFNTCPVYRRSGGHSYNAVIAGPIGSVLSPNADLEAHKDLPFASTLCGSCSNVCPVKINIHEQLWQLRQDVVLAGKGGWAKTIAMRAAGFILSRAALYRFAGRAGRMLLRTAPFIVRSKKINPWFKQREMPNAPKQSFREWYLKNRK